MAALGMQADEGVQGKDFVTFPPSSQAQTLESDSALFLRSTLGAGSVTSD